MDCVVPASTEPPTFCAHAGVAFSVRLYILAAFTPPPAGSGRCPAAYECRRSGFSANVTPAMEITLDKSQSIGVGLRAHQKSPTRRANSWGGFHHTRPAGSDPCTDARACISRRIASAVSFPDFWVRVALDMRSRIIELAVGHGGSMV